MNRLAVSLALTLCLLALGGCAAIGPPPVTGDLTITLATEPAQPVASVATTLTITAASGAGPLLGARVLVVPRPLGGSIARSDNTLSVGDEQGDGCYAAATTFAQSGQWQVQVIVTPLAGEARTTSFTVDVAPSE